jgi:hypothetical protein
MKNRRLPPLLLSLVAWSLFANASTSSHAQTRPIPVRTAYSALSAGIGTLWLSHENGHFRKHGLARFDAAAETGGPEKIHRRSLRQSQIVLLFDSEIRR